MHLNVYRQLAPSSYDAAIPSQSNECYTWIKEEKAFFKLRRGQLNSTAKNCHVPFFKTVLPLYWNKVLREIFLTGCDGSGVWRFFFTLCPGNIV